MKYTVDYFLEKFEKLTDDEVGQSLLDNHCAYWHCGVRDYYVITPEAQALSDLFDKLTPLISKVGRSTLSWSVINVNDFCPRGQSRKNIIKALEKVKKLIQ